MGFRLTMDAYWKYQAEKEKKPFLMPLLKTMVRWMSAMIKCDQTVFNSRDPTWISGGYAHVGRQFSGIGARIASSRLMSCVMYRLKFMPWAKVLWWLPRLGAYAWPRLVVPKSFFEDARSAGPFEFLLVLLLNMYLPIYCLYRLCSL